MATLRNYVLPLERDALKKRAAMRGAASVFHAAAKSSGQDTVRAGWLGPMSKGNGKSNGAAPAKTPQKSVQPEQTWWPNERAFDRQLIMLGVPFVRNGEVVVVWRDEKSGYIKSRGLGPAPRPEEKRRSIFD